MHRSWRLAAAAGAHRTRLPWLTGLGLLGLLWLPGLLGQRINAERIDQCSSNVRIIRKGGGGGGQWRGQRGMRDRRLRGPPPPGATTTRRATLLYEQVETYRGHSRLHVLTTGVIGRDPVTRIERSCEAISQPLIFSRAIENTRPIHSH